MVSVQSRFVTTKFVCRRKIFRAAEFVGYELYCNDQFEKLSSKFTLYALALHLLAVFQNSSPTHIKFSVQSFVKSRMFSTQFKFFMCSIVCHIISISLAERNALIINTIEKFQNVIILFEGQKMLVLQTFCISVLVVLYDSLTNE